MDLRGIENVIFDLGGVIVEVDYRLSLEESLKLSHDRDALTYEDFFTDSFLTEFERGAISEQEFFASFRHHLQSQASDQQITNAWNAMIIGIPSYGIELLRSLKNRFRTFVLSNTNSLHISFVDSILQNQHGVSSFSDLTEQVYYSHDMKMRKPETQIYLELLNREGLEKTTTLFIDDNRDNIEAAESLGIKTVHLTEMENLKLVFEYAE